MWKMVCDKENGVCDKVLCERLCVGKLCVWKMACDKAVCERWCVAKEQCAGSQDAVQSHQSMSLTAVTAQDEKFIAG